VRLGRADAVAALLIFCIAAGAFAWWAVSDHLGDTGGDSAVYALSAHYYSPFFAADAAARDYAQHSLYPPLYPLTLAFATSLRGAHWITVIELAAALSLFYCWLVSTGLPRIASALTTLIFAMAPAGYREALQLHSEMLYLGSSLLALIWIAAAAETKRTTDYVAAGVAVVIAALTRSVGVALMLPLFVALWRAPRGAWFAVVFTLLPWCAWQAWHAASASYLHVLSEQTGHAGALWQRALSGIAPIRDGWTHVWLATGRLAIVIDALLALAIAAALRRAWRRQADGFYVIAYLAVIAVWNYSAEAMRFLWVIAPVMLGQVLVELRSLLSAPSRPWLASYAALAAVAMCVMPSALLALQRASAAQSTDMPDARFVPEWYLADPARAEQYAATYLATEAALARVAASVPSDQCVISIKPAIVALLAGHRSVAPPDAATPDHAFMAALDNVGCDALLALAYFSPSFPTPLYPVERMQGGRWREVFRQSATLGNGAQGDVAILLLRDPIAR
jgi:hypothetical protein